MVSYCGDVQRTGGAVYLSGEIVGEVDRRGAITESTQDIFVGSETDGNQPNVTYILLRNYQ